MRKMSGCRLVVAMAGGGVGGQDMAEANAGMEVVACEGAAWPRARAGITAMPVTD